MRIKNSLKNIYTGLIGQCILLVTSFVSRTFFIKILGSTYLGVSGLFTNILSLLSLAELGVGQAITFSLYKPIANNDYNKINALMSIYQKIYRFVFCFVLVVGLSLTPFLRFIINDYETIPHITIIYILYVINSASSYLFVYRNTLITASQKNYVVNKINYIFSISMMVLQVISLLIFKNYFVYLIIQILTTITQNITIAVVSKKMFPYLDSKSVNKLADDEKNKLSKNIKSLMIYKIGTLALNSTDNILISKFVGIVKVGLYSNYLLITSTISGFLSTIFNNLTASIGNLNAVESNTKKIEMFYNINLATFWLYSVSSICIFCSANAFIQAWIGEEYLLTLRELFVIVLNVYIAGMLFAPFNYRQTMGLFVYGKLRPVISAIINIVASVYLGNIFGLEGVLWGTVIARLTTNGWYDPYIIFKKGLLTSPSKYFVDYILKLIYFVITGVICYYITSFISGFGFIAFICKAIVSFVISNLIILLIYFKTNEFKYFKSVFINILIRKRG